MADTFGFTSWLIIRCLITKTCFFSLLERFFLVILDLYARYLQSFLENVQSVQIMSLSTRIRNFKKIEHRREKLCVGQIRNLQPGAFAELRRFALIQSYIHLIWRTTQSVCSELTIVDESAREMVQNDVWVLLVAYILKKLQLLK